MNKQIEIEGEKYEIDLEQAKSLGLIKKLPKPIIGITHGDVFYSKTGGNLIIVQQARYNRNVYIFTGLCDSLQPYNYFTMSKEEVIDRLNSHGDMVWVGNINEQVKELVKSYYPTK